jgi:hypothetical protein
MASYVPLFSRLPEKYKYGMIGQTRALMLYSHTRFRLTTTTPKKIGNCDVIVV